MSSVPKGHVCPPSNAVHPSDRWESLFIYSFICKFTNLRGKVEGLETPMDLENALLLREPNTLISAVLTRFILNLRPQTRNLSADQISATVASVLGDHFKTPERTIFWDDDLQMNVDPFPGLDGGFFAADWDFKLKILRQLVEMQLTHCADIKNKIDRAWGVQQNKNKKKDATTARPDPSDPESQEHLQLLPIGQDSERKRYWVADNSPRIYISTNPWKTTATFQSISSTREEYVATIEKLKGSMPSSTGINGRSKKRSKQQISHISLISSLETRLELIDAEIARVAKVRKKIEQRKILMEQAEIRQTRTRRQTRKPDYVYSNAIDSEDDGDDEYTYQEGEGNDDEFGEAEVGENGMGSRRSSRRNNHSLPNGQRRSTRAAVLNANNKRDAAQLDDSWNTWRGERRSTRLGAPPEVQLDYEPSPKRARTDDSALSTNSSEPGIPPRNEASRVAVKASGAAALKPTEIALEQIAGRKRSKYWVYAVEPIPGAVGSQPTDPEVKSLVDDHTIQRTLINGNIPNVKPLISDAAMEVDGESAGDRDDSVLPHQNGHGTNGITTSISPRLKTECVSVSELDRTLAGSLSPLSP